MGRRWIMIELGEHCHTHIIPRLKKVIDGQDNSGITKAVSWKGGGGFRYYQLAPNLKVRLISEVMHDDLTAPSFNRDVLKETDQ